MKAWECSTCRRTCTSFRETAPTCQRCGSGPLFQRLVFDGPLQADRNRESMTQEETQNGLGNSNLRACDLRDGGIRGDAGMETRD